jgi:hypothetical protein
LPLFLPFVTLALNDGAILEDVSIIILCGKF